MHLSLRSVLTGTAAILAAAALTPAMAQEGPVHVMTVRLLGGGVEQIEYTGNVPPRVVLVPSPTTIAAPMFAPDPFATLERISAMMDQQAEAMLQRIAAMPDLAATPGSGVCTRSVQITFDGRGTRPHMVSSTSGDCGPAERSKAPYEVNAPVQPAHPEAHPRTIQVKAATRPALAPTEVAWNR